MPLVLPNTIAAGDDILAEILQGNFDAIAAKFSGGLVDADCSALMNLNGSKLAPNSMPGDRIATGTIALEKMGANSVGTTQLVAASVTKDKLATTVGQRATLAQLEIGTLTGTLTFAGVGLVNALTKRVSTAVVGGVSSWVVIVERLGQTPITGSLFTNAQTLTPATAIPSATTTPLEIVLSNLTGNTVDVAFRYLNNS